jgi:putrescine aminotransferase
MERDDKEIRSKTLEKYRNYVNPSLARLFKITGCDLVEYKSRGIYIIDTNGRKFIDCLGGYGTFNVGHSHPKVIKAVKEQLRKIPLSSKILLNKPLADLAELLAEITPGDLQYSFFCNSGTEAIEGALKLAKLFNKRKKFISCFNSFHGKTLGALSASGREIYKKPFEPLLPNFIQVPFDNLQEMEKEIDQDTSAVIVEPIQGEGGVIIPKIGYLSQLKNLCEKNGALLIVDEVQTGFGRTGFMFASEYEKVVPDILCVAKSLGGGVMPIGAFISSEKIWKCMLPNPLIHTSTFGGNPLSCAAGIATIKVIQEENLIENAKEVGSYFLNCLSEFKKEYPEVISDVRGRGLMLGVELKKEGLGGVILPEMIKRNILIAYTLNNPKVIRFEPPLIIKKKEVDIVLSAFKDSLEKAKELSEKIEGE